jgi:hypothetical protein
VVEFHSKSTYDNDAGEFVRPSCRDPAGWRRDEWAHSPLFIWGKSRPDPQAQPGASTPAARPLRAGVPIRQVFVVGVVSRRCVHRVPDERSCTLG